MSINFNINNMSKVNNLYKNDVSVKYETQTKINNKKDELDISSVARDYQTLARALANTPDIREERVNELKLQMESDTYVVNAKQIADKLLG